MSRWSNPPCSNTAPPPGADVTELGRPQQQLPDRVSETAAAHGEPFFFQFGRRFVVSRQQSAECKLRLVASGLPEIGGDFLHRRGEIGGDGDLDFHRPERSRPAQNELAGEQG